MRDFRAPVVGVVTAAMLWAVSGCDGKPSVDSSNTEATVKGVVTINGTPATEGEIAFDASNYQRKLVPLAVGPIGKDGSYSVKTLSGDNEASLLGSIVSKNKILGFQKKHVELKGGENTFNWDINLKDAKQPVGL